MWHTATHLPFRDWCVPCTAGKAPAWPRSRVTHSSTAVPMCQLDCIFLNRRGDTDILAVLNFLHSPSGASFVQCCDTGPATHVVQAATTFTDFLVHKRICLRTDGEPASGALPWRRSRATPLATERSPSLVRPSRDADTSLGQCSRSTEPRRTVGTGAHSDVGVVSRFEKICGQSPSASRTTILALALSRLGAGSLLEGSRAD